MKILKKTINALRRVNLFSLLPTVLFMLAPLAVNNIAVAQSEQTKIIASITIPSQTSVWNAAERLASEMKYLEIVRGARDLVKTQFPAIASIDSDKNIGIVVATNGDEVFPFVYLPVAADSNLDEAAISELKTKIQDKVSFEEIEVIVKDSTLFISASKFKDLIPTNSYGIATENDDKNALILDVDVNVEAVPQEFIEAGLAVLRQKIGEGASNEAALSASNLNLLLKYYSSVIDSLTGFKAQFLVDEQSNCVVDISVAFKPDSDIVKQLRESNNVQTRWSSFADAPNAVFTSVSAGKQLEGAKEYQLDQFTNVACNNLLKQLEVLIDDADDFELAKRLIELFKSEEEAGIEAGIYDSGIVVQADPLLVKIGTSIFNPEAVKEAIKLVVDRIKKDVTDLDSYISLDSEEIVGFSVSKIDIPVDAVAKDAVDYFRGKTIAARIGIDDKSMAFIVGLNSDEVNSEFARMIRGAQELKSTRQKEVVDLAPLAKIVDEIASSFNELQPAAKQSLERIAGAQDVKIVSEQEIVDNQVNLKYVLQSGIFKTAGDVIRVNLRGGGEDDSEDMDDIFDEE